MTYGEIYALGICSQKRKEESKAWVKYLFEDGYIDWLSMSPGSKIPGRKTVFKHWEKNHSFSYYEQGLGGTITRV
ncbi:MAG: hypothetical protein SWO11_22485 [Thermodesulfobacteriota bacterium]|nr:hypothetical protein [Thermodesulfobacteriota bacterium]